MNPLRTLTVAAAGLALAAGTLATVSPAQATQAAPTERAARPYVVKAAVSKDTVVQGQRVVLTGTVRKARRGDRVLVQIRYDGGGWKKADLSDKVDRKGRFRITDKIASGRSRAYRVVKPAGRGRAAGRSKAVHVVVYSWRDLTALSPATASRTGETTSLKINGATYEDSVSGWGWASEGSISYNVERDCRQLKTRVGLADTSQETATGTASLKVDGVQRYGRSFTLTQSSPVTVDLTKVFRLTFDWTSTNTAGTPEDQSGAIVALGSPQILCRD